MTFLPIVERELRVAARRPGIYRTRWLAALGTLLLCLVMLCSDRRTSSAELSQTLFISLSILAQSFCLLAGIFLTADCLSEERREGTLGLLFLTDLRSYDVVSGKLIATSVHALYGLLAVFPVLALPLLMGGVTPGEVWRVILVLLATLFLSLAMGMFVSGWATEARQAMGGAFFGMLLLAGALPAVYYLAEMALSSQPGTLWLWLSPVNSLLNALDDNYGRTDGVRDYWCSFLAIFLLAAGLYLGACLLLPRAWRGHANADRMGWRGRSRAAGWLPSPRRLVSNQYLWLASRGRRHDLIGSALLALGLLVWAGALVVSMAPAAKGSGPEAFAVSFFAAYGLHQIAKYLAAQEATRQLADDRRSGALELLLVTPLGEAQILAGHKRYFWQQANPLVGLLLLVNLCLVAVVIAGPDALGFDDTDRALFLELFLGGLVVLYCDFQAIQSTGAWLALRARSQPRAMVGTLARVMAVPWLAGLLWVLLSVTGAAHFSERELGGLFLFWFLLGIFTDVVVTSRVRIRLNFGVRYWLTEFTGSSQGKARAVSPPAAWLAQNA